ncbi:MAG: 7-cyano-7-deazaguanine synthase QueC [Pseudomonadota bacterium]
MDETAALVLFSGGQDSATCLVWALDRFDRVETIGFDYGQRHRVELDQRQTLIKAIRAFRSDWDARLGNDTVLDLPTLAQLGGTAMIEEVAIEMGTNGLPTTFVPGRNIMFLTLAGALAYRRGVKHLVTGVCETDYSGYPDCRDDTIKALQVALNLGMETRFVLHTPLMFVDKAGTWAMADELGGAALVAEIRAHSHSCYLGDRTHEHPWGFGCGSCPACELRAAGWERWTAS